MAASGGPCALVGVARAQYLFVIHHNDLARPNVSALPPR
jgi:hypothetical protein